MFLAKLSLHDHIFSCESWAMWYNKLMSCEKAFWNSWWWLKSRFDLDLCSLFSWFLSQRLPPVFRPDITYKTVLVKCNSTVKVWSLCVHVRKRPKHNSSDLNTRDSSKSSLSKFFHSAAVAHHIESIKTWWPHPLSDWLDLPKTDRWICACTRGDLLGFSLHFHVRLVLFIPSVISVYLVSLCRV